MKIFIECKEILTSPNNKKDDIVDFSKTILVFKIENTKLHKLFSVEYSFHL